MRGYLRTGHPALRLGMSMLMIALSFFSLASTGGRAVAGGQISFLGSSQASNGTSTSLTLSVPKGVNEGDVMLAAVYVRGTPAVTDPAGWVRIRRDGHSRVYYRVVGSSEPTSYSWSFSQSKNAAGAILAYTGTDPSAPLVAHSGRKSTKSTSITAPSVTTTEGDTLLVGFFATSASTTITGPSDFTSRLAATTESGKPITWEASDTIQTLAGPSGDKVATASVAGDNAGQMVAIRGASPPPGGVFRAFTDDSVWNLDVSGAPADASSGAILSFLDSDNSGGYVKIINTGAGDTSGAPVYWSNASDPEHVIVPDQGCQASEEPVRIPPGARPGTGADGHMTVIDVDRGAQYSLWKASYDPATDTYISCGLTVYWNASNGLQKQVAGTDCTAIYYAPDGCHGHRGFPPAIYNIRVDETEGGVIPHALKLGVDNTCGFVWPAQNDEGCNVSDAPPEGTRLRLKSSVDCSVLGTAAAQVVCATLKTYGLFVGDQTGGDAHIAVETTTLDGNAPSDFWVGKLSSGSLSAFPFTTQYWDVVQMSYGGP